MKQHKTQQKSSILFFVNSIIILSIHKMHLHFITPDFVAEQEILFDFSQIDKKTNGIPEVEYRLFFNQQYS